jgi:hypothetical protein
VAVSVDGKVTTPKTYGRAAAHEIRHTGGLPHPWMASENKDLGIYDVDQSNKANKKVVKANLMNSDENPNSSLGGTAGTTVTTDQLGVINKMVQKQQPKKP